MVPTWGLSLIYLLLPPSQGVQPLITSCHSIPGPLCNSAWQRRRTGLARCAWARANRIWPAACPPPALCLQHPACGSARHPRGAPLQGPSGCAPGLTPCPAGALGRAGQPQPAGPGGRHSPRGEASQVAHNTASSSAGWSPHGPGRVEMLRVTGIPSSSCCGKLATLGTMLSPAVTEDDWQDPSAGGHSKPCLEPAAWQGHWSSRGGQAEHPSLLTACPLELALASPGQCHHTGGNGNYSLASSSTTC